MRVSFLIYLMLLAMPKAYSQLDTALIKNNFNPELNSGVGLILRVYPGVPKQNIINYSSINFAFQTKGSDLWHHYYNFPTIGTELFLGTTNAKELGYSIGVVPNLVFNKTNNNYFKFGFGLAYFNRPFNNLNNNRNLYIGTPFTNMTMVGMGHNFKLNTKLKLKLGISYVHCSDGHTALPNVGLNTFMINAGLQAWNNKPKPVNREAQKDSSLIYTVRAGIGFHESGATVNAVGGPSYPCYTAAFYVGKPYKNKHIVDLGLVFNYYTSFHDYIINQEVYKSNINLKSSTGVAFIGHEYVLGKISISTQLGIYFYNPFFIKQKKLEGSWNSTYNKISAFNTNRLGLMYYPFKKRNSLNRLKNQLMCGIYIKANLGKADMFEYVAAFKF